MNESTKLELSELVDKLEEQIQRVSFFIEEQEEIDSVLWNRIDVLMTNANLTLSIMKEIIDYS